MEKKKKDIFIGGAWPYSNYFLHVGHLAALLPGDIIARFYRQNGDNVIYVSGSDFRGDPGKYGEDSQRFRKSVLGPPHPIIRRTRHPDVI